MPQPGPPRKPTALKVIEGNPGKRALNKNEPQPRRPAECPAPPDHIEGEARAEWLRRAPELWRLGVLTDVDLPVFETMCSAYGRWRQAEATLRRMGQNDALTEGLMIRTKAGNAVYNPVLAASNRALEQFKSLAVEFGMTPAARSRIVAGTPPAEQGDDPLSRLLG